MNKITEKKLLFFFRKNISVFRPLMYKINFNTCNHWGGRGVMVINVWNGLVYKSPNLGRSCLYFSLYLNLWERNKFNYSPSCYVWIIGHTVLFNVYVANILGERTLKFIPVKPSLKYWADVESSSNRRVGNYIDRINIGQHYSILSINDFLKSTNELKKKHLLYKVVSTH